MLLLYYSFCILYITYIYFTYAACFAPFSALTYFSLQQISLYCMDRDAGSCGDNAAIAGHLNQPGDKTEYHKWAGRLVLATYKQHDDVAA